MRSGADRREGAEAGPDLGTAVLALSLAQAAGVCWLSCSTAKSVSMCHYGTWATWALAGKWAPGAREQPKEAMAAGLEWLEALRPEASPRVDLRQVPTAHRQTQSLRTWGRWPQERAVVEAVLYRISTVL